jgi:hypothetical protein
MKKIKSINRLINKLLPLDESNAYARMEAKIIYKYFKFLEKKHGAKVVQVFDFSDTYSVENNDLLFAMEKILNVDYSDVLIELKDGSQITITLKLDQDETHPIENYTLRNGYVSLEEDRKLVKKSFGEVVKSISRFHYEKYWHTYMKS